MRAFTDTEQTKDSLLASLAGHREQDRLKKGTYWDNGRGCAVGCTLHDFRPGEEGKHSLYEPLFGIPRDLALLEDGIFENLLDEDSLAWPERFTRAIPVGADLSLVTRRFLHWLLSGDDSPIAKWRDDEHVRRVRELYERELAGDQPTEDEWAAAWAAACRTMADKVVELLEAAPVPALNE